MTPREPAFAVVIAAALAVISATVTGCESREAAGQDPRDTEALKGLIDLFVVEFSAGNTDGLKPVFCDDVVVYPSNDRDRVGWADVAGYWAPGFENNKIDLSVDITNIEISGSLAVIEAITYASIVPLAAPDSKPVERKYRDMIVAKRIDGFDWCVYRDLSQAYPEHIDQG